MTPDANADPNQAELRKDARGAAAVDGAGAEPDPALLPIGADAEAHEALLRGLAAQRAAPGHQVQGQGPPRLVRQVEARGQGSDSSGVVVSGERNLLDVNDIGSNMASVRKLFNVFDQKTQLMELLDVSQGAEGVKIFIGGESSLVPLDEFSVVTAPYEVDGQVVGTVGVIGPTRMAYDRMIQIVDITSRLVGNALSQR